jgi:hypothetical protein
MVNCRSRVIVRQDLRRLCILLNGYTVTAETLSWIGLSRKSIVRNRYRAAQAALCPGRDL